MNLQPGAKRIYEKLLLAISNNNRPVQQCADELLEEARIEQGELSAVYKKNFDSALEYLLDRINNPPKVYPPRRSLKEKVIVEEWYKKNERGRHWQMYRQHLLRNKKWDEDTVDGSIDPSSDEVVSLLSNPQREEFDNRGLVLGHVQSGKTANMTAVIAKAVDAGYNFIIVLTGTTDILRTQTQKRLQDDLFNLYRNLPAPNRREYWRPLTGLEDDYKTEAPSPRLDPPIENRAFFAVMKKTAIRPSATRREWGGPLGQLLNDVKRTPMKVRRSLKVLLIDDEADLASPSAAKEGCEPATINKAIRELLEELPCSSYVGYTATPFANVLIDPYPDDGTKLDELYPRNFITSLPKPKGYFGAEDLFGRSPVDAEDESNDGLPFINVIDPEDQLALDPPAKNTEDIRDNALPQSLEDAILYFICACAARRKRGDQDEHKTMLVHTSYMVDRHQIIHEKISAFVKQLGDPQKDEVLQNRLRKIWEKEQKQIRKHRRENWPEEIAFDELRNELNDVIAQIEFPVENGRSDFRVDYDDNKPRTYIVVGGVLVGRGFTLEGLMSSYFLRKSRQFDTLMQMGRWFGYRNGYQDLPRIWITEKQKLSFRLLSEIEGEIRDDITEYATRNITPADAALKIRAIPGMAITGRNKMKAAKRCHIGYWGEHTQTIRFPIGDDAKQFHSDNWDAASDLLTECEKLGGRTPIAHGQALYRGIPANEVLTFLRNYNFQKDKRDLKEGLLAKFIEETSDVMPTWNVGVVAGSFGSSSCKLGPLGKIGTVRRSRLSGSSDLADIKALMSRRDVIFDCREELEGISIKDSWKGLKEARQDALSSPPPLLLMYPIDRNSTAEQGSDTRMDLKSSFDILGLGIVFPKGEVGREEYVSVDINPAADGDMNDVREELANETAEIEALDLTAGI